MSALDIYRARKQAKAEAEEQARARKNEQNRQYYARHRETVLKRNADWRKRNADPVLDSVARSAYWSTRGKYLRKSA